MAVVDELAALQDLEDSLVRDVARLREIRALLVEPAELIEARRQSGATEQVLAELRRGLRAMESETESVRAKRKAGQDRLYGGTVTSPRELVGLETEAEALARRLAHLEDEALALMLELEQATLVSRGRAAAVSEIEARFSERASVLRAEAESLQARSTQIQASIKRQEARLPPEQLARYTALKAHKGGRAVARLRRDTCKACGVQVPTHVVQRAGQRAAEVLCPSCGRLLCPE
jgi:predicted  nucleic acid-binding Zn-ribbon protein